MSHHFDSDEINKFDALAAEWWDPNGRFRPLHALNPVRVAYIASQIPLAGAKVLDVGCGGGILTEALAGRGADVTGIDRAGKGLAVARLHASQSGVAVRYEQSDAATWGEQNGGYDVVTCLEVLEHVPDVAATIAACTRLLRPGGLFFFATLNRTPKSYLLSIIGAEYLLGWLPKGTHRYERFIRPSELVPAMRGCGLDPRDLRGMSYNLLTREFALSDDLSVNYLGYAVK